MASPKAGLISLNTVTKYLANAFSLQMLDLKGSPVGNLNYEVVSTFPDDVVSVVGHPDTAAVLGVPCNRVNLSLKKGDVLYVAQLTGGRLPEGCTSLPEGYSFTFVKLTF